MVSIKLENRIDAQTIEIPKESLVKMQLHTAFLPQSAGSSANDSAIMML